MSKKVIVAMSGGVDSSVAAALLKEQGFEVSGVFMKNWSPEDMQSLSDCPWEQDQADAAAVCEVLGIPFRSINFEKEYKEKVVDYFLAEYAAGRTPNPDVMCNKEIKFAAFLQEAEKLGANCIATGHYARIVTENDGKLRVGKAKDEQKDQSYFLYTLGQNQLAKTLFPLGALTKPEVRKLATAFKLPTATKKDSQGICFIGHIDLKKFLFEHITAKPGETYLLSEKGMVEERMTTAQLVGKHEGVMFYTIGERAGAVVDNGRYRRLRNGADVPPLYVAAKDVAANRLFVTASHQDPILFSDQLLLENWQGSDPSPLVVTSKGLTCQIRYHQKEKVRVQELSWSKDRLVVKLNSKVWAPATGQSAVIYQGESVLGGGIVC